MPHVLIAVAVNPLRLMAWGQKRPLARTRTPALAAPAGRFPQLRGAAAS